MSRAQLFVAALLASGAAWPALPSEAGAAAVARPEPLTSVELTVTPVPRVTPTVSYDLAELDAENFRSGDDISGSAEKPKLFEKGRASWYGIQFNQRKTASGERFDMGAFTAAHKTLPFNTRVCVRSLVNGREVLVRINDRGPYAANRVIDLSRAAAEAIGLIDQGIKQVALSIIYQAGDRCGDAVFGSVGAQPQVAAKPASGKATRTIAARKRR